MDATHFQNLIDPLLDKLYRFALSFVREAADAEDVVQDVVLKLWERKDQVSTIENVEAWMMRATRNRCIDRIRSKSRTNEPLELAIGIKSSERSPSAITETADTMQVIKNFMEEMTELQRSTLALRDIEGYAYDEIAELLGISLSQVKINIHRGRKHLKEQLIKANIHGYQ